MNKAARIIAFLVLIFSFAFSSAQKEKAKNGLLDLSKWDTEEVIRLDGEWSFYYSRFVDPTSVFKDSINPDIYMDVPSYWSDHKLNGESFFEKGFASYCLEIRLPDKFSERIAFHIPVFDDSYTLYINGEKKGENGKVGEDELVSKPGYMPQIIVIQPDTNYLHLVFHVSNFNHRRGGFWKSVRMGKMAIVINQSNAYNSLVYVSLGIIFTFFLLFLFIFLFYRKGIASLLFSIMLVGILIRILFTDTYPINEIADFSWIWLVRFEYLGTYLAFAFGMWYFLEFYSLPWMKKITQLNTVIMFLMIILVLVSDPTVFAFSMYYFKPVAIIFLAFYLFLSLYYSFVRKGRDIIYFITLFIFMASLVNDIMVSGSRSFLSVGYIIHLGILFFVFVNGLLLVKSFIEAFIDKARMNVEMEYMNLNLEKLIKERTEEINASKREMHRQNKQIESKNIELEASLNFNQKVYSIIAHDLKSPITSLYQVSDYLYQSYKGGELKETLHSIRELSESAAHLVDNLLYWSRGQKGEIKVNRDKLELKRLISEVAELYKVSLNLKRIKIDFLMKEDYLVFCDPHLLKIVLRNILSNAIKFSHQDDRITITAARPVESKYIVLIIEDRGAGIPEEMVVKLNKPEANLEISSTFGTANEKGSGLGIKLSHELLKLNGGKLRIESESGKGTRVMIFLEAII